MRDPEKYRLHTALLASPWMVVGSARRTVVTVPHMPWGSHNRLSVKNPLGCNQSLGMVATSDATRPMRVHLTRRSDPPGSYTGADLCGNRSGPISTVAGIRVTFTTSLPLASIH